MSWPDNFYFFHTSVLGVFDLFVADMGVAGGAARRAKGKLNCNQLNLDEKVEQVRLERFEARWDVWKTRFWS